MKSSSLYEKAARAIDEANSKDSNLESADGRLQPKELLYAHRMCEWLEKMEPGASESLKLAARSQHIERWAIPREEYPMDRNGYIKWRNALKKFHADRVEDILLNVGYDETTISRVRDLVMKKGIKSDPDVQLLEDVICLVFLKYYFEDFSQKHDEEKILRILQKTWRKMSQKGREMAMKLEMPPSAKKLVEKALA
ncbi:MAG: DUF4202 domain-containing protein [Balneolales bacterium]